MKNKKYLACTLAELLTSEAEQSASGIPPANVVDGLFAIARGLRSVAGAIIAATEKQTETAKETEAANGK